MAAAFLVGLVVAVTSRPPSSTCANPLPDGADMAEFRVMALAVLLSIILGLSGVLVAALGRRVVGLSLAGTAAGLLVAVALNATVARPSQCDFYGLLDYGEATILIDSPFHYREQGPAACYNMDRQDPDTPAVSWDSGPDWEDEIEVEWFEVTDPGGAAPSVVVQLWFEDDMTQYSGAAEQAGEGSVRFVDVPSTAGPPRPPISGSISWRCDRSVD
jgi:hypothetical protein